VQGRAFVGGEGGQAAAARRHCLRRTAPAAIPPGCERGLSVTRTADPPRTPLPPSVDIPIVASSRIWRHRAFVRRTVSVRLGAFRPSGGFLGSGRALSRRRRHHCIREIADRSNGASAGLVSTGRVVATGNTTPAGRTSSRFKAALPAIPPGWERGSLLSRSLGPPIRREFPSRPRWITRSSSGPGCPAIGRSFLAASRPGRPFRPSGQLSERGCPAMSHMCVSARYGEWLRWPACAGGTLIISTPRVAATASATSPRTQLLPYAGSGRPRR